MSDDQSPAVRVTMADIYQQGIENNKALIKLESAVTDLVAVNKRLDGHRDDIEHHSERIRKVEAQVAAQWVVVSVVIVVIGAAVVRAMFP